MINVHAAFNDFPILISAILPELQEKADAVMADLTRLGEIKQAALAEEEHLKANLEILEEEQLRIATLIAARKQSENIVTAELAAEQKAAEELAAKASSLKQLIADLRPPEDTFISAASERATHSLLAELNGRHASHHEDDSRLEARIRSYELAARMQLVAPQARISRITCPCTSVRRRSTPFWRNVNRS